jgi:peptide chain release factor 1
MLEECLAEIEEKYIGLAELMASPDVVSDHAQYQKYAREHASLSLLVETYRVLKGVNSELVEYREAFGGKDEELKELAGEEIPALELKKVELSEKLKVLLLPKDPNDDKNIVLEIRAGAGGDESALFAAEIFRMYSRYAERHGWKVEVLSSNPTGLNGLKEMIAMIEGKGAYSRLKYESGVHRVQRVPETEASGRRHTSTATVLVMPEAEEVELDVKNDEFRVDTFRAGGPGGQNVNKVETAVRITHVPTRLAVACQEEKSQHKNRQKAMKILLSRLLDMKIQEQNQKLSEARKTKVGTGDRSEKIRTYNFPQNRVTDHRIGLTLYKLTEIMDGDITELTDNIIAYYQTEAIKNFEGVAQG